MHGYVRPRPGGDGFPGKDGPGRPMPKPEHLTEKKSYVNSEVHIK